MPDCPCFNYPEPCVVAKVKELLGKRLSEDDESNLEILRIKMYKRGLKKTKVV